MRSMLIFLFLYPMIIDAQKPKVDVIQIEAIKSVRHETTHYFSEDPRDWMVSEHYWEFDIKSNLIKKGFKDLSYEDASSNEDVYYYDEKENRLISSFSIIKKDTVSKCFYTYDKAGNRERSILYSQGRLWNTTDYKYNDQGMLIEELIDLHQRKDTIYERYAYDHYGRMIMSEHISSTFHQITSWKYDERGNKSEERSQVLKAPASIRYTMNNDHSVREKTEIKKDPRDHRIYTLHFTYDENNRVMNEKKWNGMDSLLHDINFTYNDHDLVDAAYYLNPEDNTRHKLSYTYEYDVQGNWIKKYCKSEDYLESVEEREIEYW